MSAAVNHADTRRRVKRIMQPIRQTVFDVVLLSFLSVALGFGINAVRGSKRLNPTKNYFAKSAQPPAPSQGEVRAAAELPPLPKLSAAKEPPDSDSAQASRTAAISPSAKIGVEAKKKKLDHNYQEIQFEELARVFRDPGTAQGLNLFVDARKEDLYEEGHIPQALHCDHYQVGEHLDEVVARSNGVERVIVYCGGGDCEDSIFLCKDLVEAGVPQDLLYLYPGGWKEWSEKNMPVQTGGHE